MPENRSGDESTREIPISDKEANPDVEDEFPAESRDGPVKVSVHETDDAVLYRVLDEAGNLKQVRIRPKVTQDDVAFEQIVREDDTLDRDKLDEEKEDQFLEGIVPPPEEDSVARGPVGISTTEGGPDVPERLVKQVARAAEAPTEHFKKVTDQTLNEGADTGEELLDDIDKALRGPANVSIAEPPSEERVALIRGTLDANRGSSRPEGLARRAVNRVRNIIRKTQQPKGK